MIVINYYFIASIIVSIIILILVKDFYHQDDPASYVSGASQVRIPAMCEKRWVVSPVDFQKHVAPTWMVEIRWTSSFLPTGKSRFCFCMFLCCLVMWKHLLHINPVRVLWKFVGICYVLSDIKCFVKYHFLFPNMVKEGQTMYVILCHEI